MPIRLSMMYNVLALQCPILASCMNTWCTIPVSLIFFLLFFISYMYSSNGLIKSLTSQTEATGVGKRPRSFSSL